MLAIPDSVAVDSISVRRAVSQLLPPGTSETEVTRRAAHRGIGRDRRSLYFPPDSRGYGGIQINLNSDGLVRHAFGIGLWFSRARTLDSIEVHEWFTGP